MTTTQSASVDVVVVGAGPAGLSAAVELRRLGVERVVVVERELSGGGVPRHCHHTGFGLRDLHRALSGPRYGDELIRRATAVGAELKVGTTVTDLCSNQLVQLTSRNGVATIQARAIILATGARERPRSARLVAGDRAAGVFTTGQLQQWTYLKHLPVGSRALVVGAELVSFSAMVTLRHAGVKSIALTTELSHHQGPTAFAAAARFAYRVPILTSTRVVEIKGRGRVSDVILENVLTGRRMIESVDTVVFTGDWIPDNELARRAGLSLDPGTLGPSSDRFGRTSGPSIYAAGNLLHPVETADVAALRARDVAKQVAGDLRTGVPLTTAAHVTLVTEAPLTWVWPNRISSSLDVKSLTLRVADFDSRRLVNAHQDGKFLGSARIARVVPNRSLQISRDVLMNFNPCGGVIRLSLGE
ncbi:MAG: NAD(P)/FAD-dependent oxidoreductase [Acidimicrobiales bacterium]